MRKINSLSALAGISFLASLSACITYTISFSEQPAISGPTYIRGAKLIHADFDNDINQTQDLFALGSNLNGPGTSQNGFFIKNSTTPNQLSFSYSNAYATGYEASTAGAAADFDGDGFNDVAIANHYFDPQSFRFGVSILKNRGAAASGLNDRFTSPIMIDTGEDNPGVYGPGGFLPHMHLIVSDLNQDSRPDLVFAYNYISWDYQFHTSAIVIMLNEGPGLNFRRADKIIVGFPIFSLKAGDLNGDGFPDIAVGGQSLNQSFASSIKTLINTRDVRNPISPSSTGDNVDSASAIIGLEVRDANGDGKADILAALYKENIQDGNFYASSLNFALYYSKVDGSSGLEAPFELFQQSEEPMLSAERFVAEDFNNDSQIDMTVLGVNDSRLHIYQNNNTHLQEKYAAATYSVSDLISVDINGDGFIDVLGIDYWSGGLKIHLNQSASTS